MKICSTCKKEKELSLFFKNAQAKDGHMGRCKRCHVTTDQYHLKRKLANAERRKQITK